MNTKLKERLKTIKTIKTKTRLQTPPVPLSFLRDTLDDRSWNALTGWMEDNEVPEEILELLVTMSWSLTLQREAAVNNGLLSEVNNAEVSYVTIEYIKAICEVEALLVK